MKIKTIEFTYKQGQPNFGSVGAGASAEVGEGEDINKAYQELKEFVIKNCNADPAWINEKREAEKRQTKLI